MEPHEMRPNIHDRGVRMPRYPIGGFRPLGRLHVIHPGIHVVPGDTLKEFRMRLSSRTTSWAHDLTGMHVDYWLIYCPYRLAWEGFPQWMATNGATGTLPRLARDWAWHGVYKHKHGHSDAADPWRGNALFIDAYEAIANSEMFRYPERGDFSVQAGDTPDKQLARLPATDLLSEFPTLADDPDDGIGIPLVLGSAIGGTGAERDRATLFLRDIYTAWEEKKYKEEQERGELDGNTPDENLAAAYGVDLQSDTGLIEQPEVLAHRHEFMFASRYVDDSDASVSSIFQEGLDWRSDKRRLFSEHGVVMLLSGLRVTHLDSGKAGGLVGHMRDTPQHMISPFMAAEPYIEAPEVNPERKWSFVEGDDILDSREEMFRGETVIVGASKQLGESADEVAARSYAKGSPVSRTDRAGAVVNDGGFTANTNWPSGAVAEFGGLVTFSIDTPVPRPVMRKGFA